MQACKHSHVHCFRTCRPAPNDCVTHSCCPCACLCPAVGMALATMFVTLPFIVRELIPTLEQMDLAQEEAAKTLGANPLQVGFKTCTCLQLVLLGLGWVLRMSPGTFDTASLCQTSSCSSTWIDTLIHRDEHSVVHQCLQRQNLHHVLWTRCHTCDSAL